MRLTLSYVLMLLSLVAHVAATTEPSLLSTVKSLENLLHTLDPDETSKAVMISHRDTQLGKRSSSSAAAAAAAPPRGRRKLLLPRTPIGFQHVREYDPNSQVSIICTGVCETGAFFRGLAPVFTVMLRRAIDILLEVAMRNPFDGLIPQAAQAGGTALAFQVLPSASSSYRLRTYSVPGVQMRWSVLTLSLNALSIFLAQNRIVGLDYPLEFEIWDGNRQVGKGVVDYITN